MNAIMDFYGSYGMESALTEKRGFIKDLFTKVRRSSILSGGKENSFVKYSKDLENLSTENLKQEPTKLNYSYDDVVEMFEYLKEFDANKCKEIIDKYLEPMRKKYDELFKMEKREYNRSKLSDRAFYVSGLLSAPLLARYNGILSPYGLLEFLLYEVVIMSVSSSLIPYLVYGKSKKTDIEQLDKEVKNQAHDVLKANKTKLETVSKELTKCLPNKDKPSFIYSGLSNKKEYEWTYEQKVKLVELLKELHTELKDIASNSKTDKENLLKLDRIMMEHEESYTTEVYIEDDGYREEYYELTKKYLDVYKSIQKIINFKSYLYDLVFQICKDLNKL